MEREKSERKVRARRGRRGELRRDETAHQIRNKNALQYHTRHGVTYIREVLGWVAGAGSLTGELESISMEDDERGVLVRRS